MRRAVIDRRTTETQIALTHRRSTARAGTSVRTGIRFLDHMLELVRAARRVRSDGRGAPAISTSISTTPSRISASRSARPCRRRSATARGINRAGYFVMPMDETLAVAAIDLGGRPHAVVDLKVKVRARRRSADRARPRLLRGLRDRRARQRAREGAVRPLEPPHDRGGVQGVRARAARRRARRTSGSRGCCRARRACCDRAHRLRRRQPDVGAEGARRGRRRRRTRRPRPASSRGAPAIIVPGVGHFGATRALDDAVGRRDPRARRRGPAAARHLPRHAVAVRGQRGSAGPARPRPAARAAASACAAARPGRAREGSARRLERARRSQRDASIVDGVADRRAGVLHAQLRRARHRRHGRRHRARRAVRRRSCSAATSPACSSTRRSRATSGCRSSATSSSWLG